MIPAFRWRQLSIGTPAVPQGQNEEHGSTWRRTFNLGFEGPGAWLDWQDVLNQGGPTGLFLFDPGVSAEPVQIVRTARREGFAERDWYPASEDYDAVRIELEIAAGAAFGSWTAVSPYDSTLEAFSGVESDEETDPGPPAVRHMKCYARETKYIVRWAPPFSSRLRCQISEEEDAVRTPYQIDWAGSAGITLGGVQRCIPAAPADPLTDSMWIYDPAGESILSYPGPDIFKTVIMDFWSSTRGAPFPP